MKRIASMVTVALLMMVQVAAAEIREAPPAATAEPAARPAAAKSELSYWGDAGYGSLAVITNIFYMPAKICYAAVGLPVGGLAYLLTAGDSEISDRIWDSSLGGDYVVTPGMLLGEQSIGFNGRPQQ